MTSWRDQRIYEPENYQEGVCALGHVFDRLGESGKAQKQVLVRGNGDALKTPKSKQEVGDYGVGQCLKSELKIVGYILRSPQYSLQDYQTPLILDHSLV